MVAAGYRNLSHLDGDFQVWRAGHSQIWASRELRVRPTQPQVGSATRLLRAVMAEDAAYKSLFHLT